jgi:hypothetical protein
VGAAVVGEAVGAAVVGAAVGAMVVATTVTAVGFGSQQPALAYLHPTASPQNPSARPVHAKFAEPVDFPTAVKLPAPDEFPVKRRPVELRAPVKFPGAVEFPVEFPVDIPVPRSQQCLTLGQI